MNVLILSPGTDVGGGGIALKRAFDLHPNGVAARHVRTRDSEYRYPEDVTWTRSNHRTIAKLGAWADLFHVFEMPEIVRKLPGWRSKTIVVQHVGSRFRKDPKGYSARCRAMGAYEIAGSHELAQYLPAGEMVPIVVPFETLADHRQPNTTDVVRIAHAPTNRNAKSTEPFLAACERLATRHHIEVDVIEHVPWAECIERKARTDIYFDQLWRGYGGNAIEAWAMRIPVIAGMQKDPEARAMLIAEWGSLPFVEATEDTIVAALEPLIADRALREHWGEVGYAHADRIHSERVTAERMVGVYARAIAAKA